MIVNTHEAIKVLTELPVETFLLAVDDEGNEYVIEGVKKVPTHSGDDKDWCYAFKIKKARDGCVKYREDN